MHPNHTSTQYVRSTQPNNIDSQYPHTRPPHTRSPHTRPSHPYPLIFTFHILSQVIPRARRSSRLSTLSKSAQGFTSSPLFNRGESIRRPISTRQRQVSPMQQQQREMSVTFSITDQGPEENQTKLFNNFVQIRPSSLQKGQGSGLGLALCKAIVHLHGRDLMDLVTITIY